MTVATAAALDNHQWGEISCHVLRLVVHLRLRSSRTAPSTSSIGASCSPGPAQPSAPGWSSAGSGRPGCRRSSRASRGRLLQASSGTVTFGSNYSDEVAQERLPGDGRGHREPRHRVSINTIDHNSYQENITNYLQQPDDLMTWFAGYRLRFFAAQGLVGDITRRVGGPHRLHRRLQDRLDRRRTASSTWCPSTTTRGPCYYSKSLFEDGGYDDPGDVGRADRAGRPDASRRDHPVRRRQRAAAGRRWARSTSSTCGSTATTSTSA